MSLLNNAVQKAGQEEASRGEWQDYANCPICHKTVRKSDLKISKKVRAYVCSKCRKIL